MFFFIYGAALPLSSGGGAVELPESCRQAGMLSSMGASTAPPPRGPSPWEFPGVVGRRGAVGFSPLSGDAARATRGPSFGRVNEGASSKSPKTLWPGGKQILFA